MEFVRQILTPEQFQTPVTRGLVLTSEIQRLSLPGRNEPLLTRARLRVALGSAISEALYQLNPAIVLARTALVLSDLQRGLDHPPKDVQLTLVVNAVSALTDRRGNSLSGLKKSAMGLLDALGLPNDFRQEVQAALFDEGALRSKLLVIYRQS